MGSFDVTCALSDAGISCGDRVLVFLAVKGGNGRNKREYGWTPICYGIPGVYDDYGRVKLDNEFPDHILSTLGEFIMPFEQGKNPYHEHEVDPNNLSWESISEAVRQGRFYAKLPSFARNKNWKNPLQAIFDEHGLNIRVSSAGKYGSSLYYGSIEEWDLEKQREIEETVRNLPEIIEGDYQVITVKKDGAGYSHDKRPSQDSEDWHRSFLFVPKLKQHNVSLYFGELPAYNSKVSILIVREDVFNSFIDDSVSDEIGILLMEKCKEFRDRRKKAKTLLDFEFLRLRDSVTQLKPYESFDKRNGIWYGEEGHVVAGLILDKMILSTPEDDQKLFSDWVKVFEMKDLAEGHLRRGLRPTVQHVGSQCASEDWPKQLEFHKKMVSILEGVIADNLTIELYSEEDESIREYFDGIEEFMAWFNERFSYEFPLSEYESAIKIVKLKNISVEIY